MASGAARATAHQRCPRSLVRSTSHAPPTPSTRQMGTVKTTSMTVFRSSSPTRGRKMSPTAVFQPVAAVMYATYPSGMSENSAISTAMRDIAETPKGGRGRLPRPAVVVLSEFFGSTGADRSVVTELQQSCLGHQVGDLRGIQ